MFQFGSKRLKFCKELGGATRPGSLGAKAPSKSRRQRRIDYCDCCKTKVAQRELGLQTADERRYIDQFIHRKED